MKKDKSFHDYIVHDILEGIPNISSKAMFSGWGIYKNGKIFAIITDGELYFSARGERGDEVKKYLENLGSHPFAYNRKGKLVTLSYWLAPEELFENREALYEFINKYY
ncbi:MAG TPA: TfoX/Sxy family protein [Candidatus Paceibacterota bacterium]